MVADIDQVNGEQVVAELGDKATFVKLDVTQRDSWDDVTATAVEVYGGLNILYQLRRHLPRKYHREHHSRRLAGNPRH